MGNGQVEESVPTSSEQDIFLRWLAVAKDRDIHYNPAFIGESTSHGTVFGNQASLRAVHCIGNSFADLEVTASEDSDVEVVRVLIFYNGLQGIQVYYEYGNRGVEVPMEVCTPFQTYNTSAFIKFIEDLTK